MGDNTLKTRLTVVKEDRAFKSKYLHSPPPQKKKEKTDAEKRNVRAHNGSDYLYAEITASVPIVTAR